MFIDQIFTYRIKELLNNYSLHGRIDFMTDGDTRISIDNGALTIDESCLTDNIGFRVVQGDIIIESRRLKKTIHMNSLYDAEEFLYFLENICNAYKIEKSMEDYRLEETATKFDDNQSRNTDSIDSKKNLTPDEAFFRDPSERYAPIFFAFIGAFVAYISQNWAYYYYVIITTLVGFGSVYTCVCLKREYPWMDTILRYTALLIYIGGVSFVLTFGLFLFFGVNLNCMNVELLMKIIYNN